MQDTSAATPGKEFIAPALIEVPTSTNATQAVVDHAANGLPALFSVRDDNGEYRDVSALEFLERVRSLAKGLAAAGIEPGDRVGIMARTRYEWTLVDYAIWFAGAISVPIYETSSPSQVAWIVSDSGTKAVFAESESQANVVKDAITSENLDSVQNLWTMDAAGLEELAALGTGVHDSEIESRRNLANLDDVATIIYTSGTTGKPKGCELTHKNFVALSRNAGKELAEVIGGRTIMFLPLAHVFARFIAVMCVEEGVTVAHTPDVKNLLPDLQSFQPTFILCVPRVFEKVYNSSQLKAEESGKGKIFAAGAQTAVDYSRAQQEGKVPFGLRIKHAVFDKLLFSKIRAAMGGKVEFAVSGGAPLGERLGHFFHGIGLLVLEGYGLTETTAPVTVNTPKKVKIGTVGRPIPGNAVRIAEDGEILAGGNCVFAGYYNREDLTEEVFEDGWFRTGDLGSLDEDGFLTITGRKKEIIVTAGGKNVAPAQLEDRIRSAAIVSQTVVLGDGKPFISALVTLDEEALPGWLERHGMSGASVEEAAASDAMREEIQKLVDKANESVSHAEAIKEFRIVPEDFTEASGHLTPSMKIKRAKVLTDYQDVIEEIYSRPAPTS